MFDSGTGYAEGDSIRITFKSQSITVSANDYEITDATGQMFYTSVRQTMRGTDGANTVTPDAAGTAPTAVEVRQEMDSNSTQLAAIVDDTGAAGVVLSAAQMNKIADHILRRAFATAAASSDGDAKSFRSLLGAVAKLVNKVAISGTTLSIYEADDSTSLGSQTLTTDAAAEPITGADTV